MPAAESMILCLCIAARACQHPRGPLAVWRDCGRSSTEYRGGRTPHGIVMPPDHLAIEGPDVGYDGRLHLGVAIDANHLPAPGAKDLPNTARSTEEFQ